MATLPTRPPGRARERAGRRARRRTCPREPRIGHVHLQVALDSGRGGLLRRRARLRADRASVSRARCSSRRAATTTMSALNTWAGEGAPPPPPGARGLRRSRSCCRMTLLSKRRRGRPRGGRSRGHGGGRTARRRRPVGQPGRARPAADARQRGRRPRLPLVLVRGVPGAEVAERHPERPMLHLPHVAELVRDEVVRDVMRSAAGGSPAHA